MLDDDTLDFLDLASPPLDDLNVFNHIMGDLLDDAIDVYFAKDLKYVALGPDEKDRNPERSRAWSDSVSQVFRWLHAEKSVESIRQILVSDCGCGGDSRIRSALRDSCAERPLFSGVEVFAWLAPNVSLRTIESVAPTVKNLSLAWDGCTNIVLEAWQTDLMNYKLPDVRLIRAAL